MYNEMFRPEPKFNGIEETKYAYGDTVSFDQIKLSQDRINEYVKKMKITTEIDQDDFKSTNSKRKIRSTNEKVEGVAFSNFKYDKFKIIVNHKKSVEII